MTVAEILPGAPGVLQARKGLFESRTGSSLCQDRCIDAPIGGVVSSLLAPLPTCHLVLGESLSNYLMLMVHQDFTLRSIFRQ